jgi:hypothetical protein
MIVLSSSVYSRANGQLASQRIFDHEHGEITDPKLGDLLHPY